MRRLAFLFGLLLLVVPVVDGCSLDQAGVIDLDASANDASVDVASASCTDAAKNGAETDVDCGSTCPKCSDGKGCLAPVDCVSGVCTGSRCAVPSCADGVKNGSETDIDCGGSCAAKCADTKACSVAADCQSGACPSKVCVPIACTDRIKNGAETDIDCGGGTCGACVDGKVCALARDCGAASYCNALRCAPKVSAGTACTVDGQCATGNCVDSVCCAQTAANCNGCRACNVTGFSGACTNVPATQDPHNTCALNVATCELGKCAGDGTCSAPNSTSCGATTCTIDTRTDHVCVGGSCTDPTTSCGPYLCNGNACGTTCVTDATCATTDYCDQTGHCVPRKASGACNLSADCNVPGVCRECSSAGGCVDGFCCNAACGSACQACSVFAGSSADGTCVTVPAGSAGHGSCAPFVCGGAVTCPTTCVDDTGCVAADYCDDTGTCVTRKVQGGVCNLATQCKVAGACRECVTGNCVDGFCCDTACGQACQTCSTSLGATTNGTCGTASGGKPGRPTTCSPFVCDGSISSCPTSCTNDSGCAAGFYCATNGTCAARKATCSSCCDARAGKDCKVADCRVCLGGTLCTCKTGSSCPGPAPAGDCP